MLRFGEVVNVGKLGDGTKAGSRGCNVSNGWILVGLPLIASLGEATQDTEWRTTTPVRHHLHEPKWTWITKYWSPFPSQSNLRRKDCGLSNAAGLLHDLAVPAKSLSIVGIACDRSVAHICAPWEPFPVSTKARCHTMQHTLTTHCRGGETVSPSHSNSSPGS